jgi:hypothetical protein
MKSQDSSPNPITFTSYNQFPAKKLTESKRELFTK